MKRKILLFVLGVLCLSADNLLASPLQILSQGSDGSYTTQKYIVHLLGENTTGASGRIWVKNISNEIVSGLKLASLPAGFTEQPGSCTSVLSPQSSCYFQLNFNLNITTPSTQAQINTITVTAANNVTANLQTISIVKDKDYLILASYDYPNFHGISHVTKLISKDDALYATVTIDKFSGIVGGLYASTDGGSSWYFAHLEPNSVVNTMAYQGNTIYLATDHGILMSQDNGATWPNSVTALVGTNVHALASSISATFAGTDNGIYVNHKNSSNWSLAGLANQAVIAILINKNLIYAATAHQIYLSTDHGKTWSTSPLAEINSTINGITLQRDNLYLNTDNGIYVSIDAGKTWQAGGLQQQNIVAFTTLNNISYAATSTNVYQAVGEGLQLNWSATPNGLLNNTITSLAVSNNILTLGTDGPIYQYQQNSWQFASPLVLNSGVASLLVNHIRDHKTWYVGEATVNTTSNKMAIGHGLYFSDDNGDTWNSIAYFAQQDILALTQMGNNLLVGTQHGLYRYSLESSTVKFFGLADQTINCIVEINHVLYVGTNNGLFFTKDNKHWNQVALLNNNPVYTIVQADNMIFVGTEHGLFVNAKKTWQRVDTVDPTTHVYSLAFIKKTHTLFLSGRCLNTNLNGVIHTVDNGQTWQGDYSGLTTYAFTQLQNGFTVMGTMYGLAIDTYSTVSMPFEFINIYSVYAESSDNNTAYLVGQSIPALLKIAAP